MAIYKTCNSCQCCKETKIVIAMINTNCAKDDDVELSLNGTNLGPVNHDTNTCTGRLFTTIFGGITTYTGIPGCACAYNLQPTIVFSQNLFIIGTNTISTAFTVGNNNGNFGAMQVACLVKSSGGTWSVSQTLLNTTYGGPPQSFNFTYTGNCGGSGYKVRNTLKYKVEGNKLILDKKRALDVIHGIRYRKQLLGR